MAKHHFISLPYFHIFTHTFHKVISITYYTYIFIIMGMIWHKSCLNICCTRWTLFLSLHSILFFHLLLVIMKPLILVYCYYDGSHNVLDTMKVFTYVDLIIIRKTYDFYHVNTLINLSNVYRWRSVTFIAGPFFLLHTCYNGPTFILTHYGGNV